MLYLRVRRGYTFDVACAFRANKERASDVADTRSRTGYMPLAWDSQHGPLERVSEE